MTEEYSLRTESRIVEIQGKLVLRMACGGPDFLEQEEELLDELAALEHEPGGEPDPRTTEDRLR